MEKGWLFRFRHYERDMSPMSTQALTFVPDPEHLWNPNGPPARWEMLDQGASLGLCERSQLDHALEAIRKPQDAHPAVVRLHGHGEPMLNATMDATTNREIAQKTKKRLPISQRTA